MTPSRPSVAARCVALRSPPDPLTYARPGPMPGRGPAGCLGGIWYGGMGVRIRPVIIQVSRSRVNAFQYMLITPPVPT